MFILRPRFVAIGPQNCKFHYFLRTGISICSVIHVNTLIYFCRGGVRAWSSNVGANKRTNIKMTFSIGSQSAPASLHSQSHNRKLSVPLSIRSAMRCDKNVVTISNRMNIYFDLMAIHLYSCCLHFVSFRFSPSLSLSFALLHARALVNAIGQISAGKLYVCRYTGVGYVFRI